MFKVYTKTGRCICTTNIRAVAMLVFTCTCTADRIVDTRTNEVIECA